MGWIFLSYQLFKLITQCRLFKEELLQAQCSASIYVTLKLQGERYFNFTGKLKETILNYNP